MRLRLLVLGGCVGVGLSAAAGGCSGGDDAGPGLLAGVTDGGTSDGGATDAAAAADADRGIPVSDAAPCWGSEQSSRGDVQTNSSAFAGTGLGPAALTVEPASGGELVVTVTEPSGASASRLSFHAVTPNTALVDTAQVITASEAPVPDDVTPPLPVAVSSGALSRVDGWTYLGLTGSAGASGDLAVTYLVACPPPGAAPSPVTAAPDATLARLYSPCLDYSPRLDTTDQGNVYPAGGTVQLAVAGETVSATVSLDGFAQATVAFAADSASTGVLVVAQQAQLPSSGCGTDAGTMGSTGPVTLSGGSFAVVAGVLYLGLTGADACGQEAAIELACSVPTIHQ